MALFEDKDAARPAPTPAISSPRRWSSRRNSASNMRRCRTSSRPRTCRWERSPDGLIKHLVNKEMHTRECCMEAYMQFLKTATLRQASPHVEELFFVVEGSDDLHWD